MLNIIFFVCFGVGIGYTVISSLLGHLVDAVDIDGDFDFGTGVSPFKPVVIASFITVFGGVGMLAVNLGIGSYVSVCISAFAALLVAFLIYRYVIVTLSRLQSTSAVDQRDLIGLIAKVTLKVPQGAYGKIRYSINGNIYNAPVKSEDGSEIAVGEDVEILYIHDNTFYVKKNNKEVVQCHKAQ